MRSTSWITAVAVSTCGLILAATPGPALGQSVGLAVGDEIRPGTRIPVVQLLEVVGADVMIGETEKNLSVTREGGETSSHPAPIALRVELLGNREGVLATWQSEARRIDPGRAYPVWPRWLGSEAAERLVAPLKPAEFVIFRIGQKTIAAFPDVCKDAPYALMFTLVTAEGRPLGRDGSCAVCLGVER